MITFTYPDTDTGAGITAPASEDDLERSDAALSDWLEEQWSSPAWRWERLMAQTGDPPPHDSDALLRRIEDAEALVTHLQARQARDLAALRAVRLADQRAAHGPAPASSRVDPDGWVPSEVGFALGLSEAQVRRRLAFAAGLHRYRHLARLVDDGGVVAWTAHSVVEHLDALSALVSPARLEVVESACVAWLSARPRTVAALNRRMRRLVLQARIDAGLDGDGIVGRGHADRRVSVATRGDGCAELWAWLPEADALAVAAALDLAAPPSAQMPSEEPRTRAQRRADVLVAAVTGAPASYGSTDDIAAGSLRPGPVASSRSPSRSTPSRA